MELTRFRSERLFDVQRRSAAYGLIVPYRCEYAVDCELTLRSFGLGAVFESLPPAARSCRSRPLSAAHRRDKADECFDPRCAFGRITHTSARDRNSAEAPYPPESRAGAVELESPVFCGLNLFARHALRSRIN